MQRARRTDAAACRSLPARVMPLRRAAHHLRSASIAGWPPRRGRVAGSGVLVTHEDGVAAGAKRSPASMPSPRRYSAALGLAGAPFASSAARGIESALIASCRRGATLRHRDAAPPCTPRSRAAAPGDGVPRPPRSLRSMSLLAGHGLGAMRSAGRPLDAGLRRPRRRSAAALVTATRRWSAARAGPLRLPRRRRRSPRASSCATSSARAHDLDPGRAGADGLRRPARAGHADDARRGAGAAGARLPAQPAPRRSRRRHRLHHRRLGRQRRRREDARRHRALRREDGQARRHHRLRPGHGLRRPDGRARLDPPAGRQRALGAPRPGHAVRPARSDAPPGEHLQVGRLGARLRAVSPERAAASSSRTSAATTPSTPSPAGCRCTTSPVPTRSSTRPAG